MRALRGLLLVVRCVVALQRTRAGSRCQTAACTAVTKTGHRVYENRRLLKNARM
jgi:hypothetical protein